MSTGLTQSKERYLSENLKWMVKYYALNGLYSPLSPVYYFKLCFALHLRYDGRISMFPMQHEGMQHRIFCLTVLGEGCYTNAAEKLTSLAD